MSFLVTGAAGFIGSNLCHFLTSLRHKVVGLDNFSVGSSWSNLEGLSPFYFALEIGDLAQMSPQKFQYILMRHDVQAVIHLAAASHVDRSISSDDEFYRTNVCGTANLMRACVERGKKIRVFLNQCCYDDQTLALTTKGFKRYDEIHVGDRVLSINKQGVIEEKQVLEVVIQDYNGEMIGFGGTKHPRVDLLVTPNHRTFYQDLSLGVSWKAAEEMLDGTKYPLPQGKFSGDTSTTIEVPNIGLVDSKDLLYLTGVFLGDGFTAEQTQTRANKSGYSKSDYMKKCRNSSTGRFDKVKTRGEQTITTCYCPRIFFDIPEKDKAREKLEATLTRLGINWHSEKGKSGEHIYFSSSAWLKYFEQFGQGAENKHISTWIWKYDSTLLQYLFDGLIDSDGCYKGGISFITVSKELHYQICLLGVMLGLNVKFREVTPKTSILSGRSIISKKRSFVSWFTTHPKTIGKHNSYKQDYSGKIWCLKVEDNKNFIVSRNGFLTLCGNTDEVYGSIESPLEAYEGDVLNPTSPYAASKAAQFCVGQSYWKTFGLPVISTFPSNTFGPRQWPEKFIPRAALRILREEPIPLMKSSGNTRDWLYIDDHCEGLYTATCYGEPGGSYNMGASSSLTNLEIAQTIISWNGRGLIQSIPDRPGHDTRYAVNSDKLKCLGWAPSKSVHTHLLDTLDWYKTNMKQYERVWA
jgi:dTDP-D-glucose 4,6-dehydratase